MTSVVGRWRIVETENWDRDALDLVAPDFIEFDEYGLGSLGFIAVEGSTDWREVQRDVMLPWPPRRARPVRTPSRAGQIRLAGRGQQARRTWPLHRGHQGRQRATWRLGPHPGGNHRENRAMS
jgi:hypothetical protein